MGIIKKITDTILGNKPLIDPTAVTPKKPSDQFVGGRTGPGTYSWKKKVEPTPTVTPKVAVASKVAPKAPVVTKATQFNTQAPFANIIGSVWGEVAPDADRILAGENSRREIGLQMDIANRINPQTGRWDSNALVMLRKNPMTGKMIASIDRGLFRINNITFYDYLNRKPELLKKNGITKWDDMLDTEKNIKFAKIIYDTQGIKAWYGAK